MKSKGGRLFTGEEGWMKVVDKVCFALLFADNFGGNLMMTGNLNGIGEERIVCLGCSNRQARRGREEMVRMRHEASAEDLKAHRRDISDDQEGANSRAFRFACLPV
jgi:hypothetical protein